MTDAAATYEDPSTLAEWKDNPRRIPPAAVEAVARVCSGDWSRVVMPSALAARSCASVGILLDPPYSLDERDAGCYAEDRDGISAEVRSWCLENGANPAYRIALCGYAGEGHEALRAAGWSEAAWKAHGGMGNRADGRGAANRFRERVWFSPACRPRHAE